MKHLLSLSVGTDTPEQHKAVHSLLSDVGAEFTQDYPYVSVTSARAELDDEDGEEYYDENTLLKVREAIKEAIETRVATAPEQMITDIISELQNAGILFRERR